MGNDFIRVFTKICLWAGIGIAGIVTMLGVINFLHRHDVCFRELRIVSDQEIIDEAIAVRLPGLASEVTEGRATNDRPSWVGGKIPEGSRILTHYADIADFKRRNPNCCRIIKNAEEDGLYQASNWDGFWIFGRISSRVVLDHVTEIATPSGQILRVRREQDTPISACGRRETKLFSINLGDGDLLKN